MQDIKSTTTVRDIINKAVEDVSEICDIHKSLIFSRSRQEDVATARFFLYTILRNSGFTWVHIGEIMKRDHGAAVMGYRRLGMRLLCNEKLLIKMRDDLIERGWRFKEYILNDN